MESRSARRKEVCDKFTQGFINGISAFPSIVAAGMFGIGNVYGRNQAQPENHFSWSMLSNMLGSAGMVFLYIGTLAGFHKVGSEKLSFENEEQKPGSRM